MNGRSDQKELLNDVLAEASSPDFRAAMLGETLRLARRRRRWRQTRRSVGGLAVLLFAAWFAWQNRLPQTAPIRLTAKSPSVAKSYRLIETRPLSSSAILTTMDFAGVRAVSSTASVAMVTTHGGNFRFINDAQLLALAGPRPALLVRTGPNSEELVFAASGAQSAPHEAGPTN